MVMGKAWNKIKAGFSNIKEDLFGTKYDPSQADTTIQDGGRMRDYLWGQMGGVHGRQAPQAAAARIAMGPQNQIRQRELTLADQLARVATGQERGAGEMAVGRQMNQAGAQQHAMARMARGGNAAIGARAAARTLGDIGVTGAGMSSQAALADQAAARGQLGALLGQTRGADIGLATGQAGLNQQTSLANMHAQLTQTGMNDAAAQAAMAQMLGISVAELNARMQLEGLKAGSVSQGLMGDLLAAGGQIGAGYLGRPRTPTGGA